MGLFKAFPMSKNKNNTSYSSTLAMPSAHIIIPRLVREKIMHFVMKANIECSGLGVTEIVGGNIIVRDIIMVKQRNSAGSTDMEADAVSKAMFHYREHAGTMNYWWHSHANMGVFWSATDKDTIAQIGAGGMCVASVFNREGKVLSAISCVSPFNLFIDNVTTSVPPYLISKDLTTAWDKEFQDNTTTTTSSTYNWEDHFKEKDERDAAAFPLALPGASKKLKWEIDADDRWLKRQYCNETEEIIKYHPFQNEFELNDGTFVGCDEYIASIDKALDDLDKENTHGAH